MTAPTKSPADPVGLNFFSASGKRNVDQSLITPVVTEGVGFTSGKLLQLGNPSSTVTHDASSSSSISSGLSTGGGCTAPLTIFYNGTVSVFQVPVNKAMTIMMMAEMAHAKEVTEIASQPASPPPPIPSAFVNQQYHDTDLPNGDWLRARRLSLQRFMERRKKTKII